MVSSEEESGDEEKEKVQEQDRIANELFEGDEDEEGEITSHEKKQDQQFDDLEASDEESGWF